MAGYQGWTGFSLSELNSNYLSFITTGRNGSQPYLIKVQIFFNNMGYWNFSSSVITQVPLNFNMNIQGTNYNNPTKNILSLYADILTGLGYSNFYLFIFFKEK